MFCCAQPGLEGHQGSDQARGHRRRQRAGGRYDLRPQGRQDGGRAHAGGERQGGADPVLHLAAQDGPGEQRDHLRLRPDGQVRPLCNGSPSLLLRGQYGDAVRTAVVFSVQIGCRLRSCTTLAGQDAELVAATVV